MNDASSRTVTLTLADAAGFAHVTDPVHEDVSAAARVGDLAGDGSDMLVLLGPTMSVERPGHVLRWRDALRDQTGAVVDAERLDPLCELPYHVGAAHADGFERRPEAGERAFHVIYDGPADHRVDRRTRTVDADVVQPPPR